MSSSEERNGTKFIWKIENFGCLKDKYLTSPTFRSHSVMWEVRISTDSSEEVKITKNDYNIRLCPINKQKGTYNCSIAILNSDGFPLTWNEGRNVLLGYDTQYCLKRTFQLKRSEMFGSRRTAILLNNTLTVQCLIWQTPEELVLPLRCFARTRIQPEAEIVEKTFIWNIENAKSFTIPQTRVEAMGGNFDSLTIKLFLDKDDKFHVTFKSSLYRIQVMVKISLLDVMGNNTQFINGKCKLNEEYKEWTIKTNISKTMLLFYENLFLPQDTLSIRFTCTLSAITFHRMENEDEILVNNPHSIVPLSPIPQPIEGTDEPESKQPNKSAQSDSISQALQEMYEEGFLTDYVLRIGSTEYPVHKAVLGARSEVFKAMFTTDMKEKDENCVDIQDFDGDTLQRLLRFVYSDSVEGRMGWENASKLYVAADKYALESLKRRCSAILKSGLCLPSALQVLKLADMHQDQHLKSAALNFISSNNKEIVGTDSWLKFEEENVKLAFETLRKLYLQKVDR